MPGFTDKTSAFIFEWILCSSFVIVVSIASAELRVAMLTSAQLARIADNRAKALAKREEILRQQAEAIAKVAEDKARDERQRTFAALAGVCDDNDDASLAGAASQDDQHSNRSNTFCEHENKTR